MSGTVLQPETSSRPPASTSPSAQPEISQRALNHLQALEAESIHIFREAVAEFARPVMLYSIGKDSSVMLRLAQKAFFPGKIPFPLLHVDTSYKFPEMIEFRDNYAREIGRKPDRAPEPQGARRGRESVHAGHAELLRTAEDALAARSRWKRAASTRRLAGRGAMRKSPAPRSASIPSAMRRGSGTRRISGRSCGTFTTRACARARAFASFRCRTGRSWTSGSTSTRSRFRLCRCTLRASARLSCAARSIILKYDDTHCFPARSRRCMKCRMRSLGCAPCTGAIRCEADTLPKIIEELICFRRTERENRAIDHDEEGSMELKKREGYF